MAKRKAWQRAIGGLGEGIGNASQMLLHQQMLDQQNERILTRQKALDDQNFVETLLQAAAKGDYTPEQVEAIASGRGLKVPANRLQTVRPSIANRLGAALDKPLADAKSPEDLLGDADIAAIARRVGAVQEQPPAFATEGMEPQSGALAGLAPEAVDYAQRFETKRRALMSKPTERAEVTDPLSGAKSLTFVSPYAGPIQTSPTAAQEGALAGAKDVANLNVSGQAKAAQAGKEATATATATQAVTNAPQNQQARVNEARMKKRAELQEELAQSGMSPQQQSAALQLSDDFYNQSKDYFEVATSFRKIAGAAQRIRDARATGSDSPASNIGMVFAYMKMLDPASTVREGEQAQARDARGVPDAILAQYNAIVNGGKLSDAQIADFTRSAAQLYSSAKTDHDRRIQDFTQRATQYRVPPALVVREPDPTLDTLATDTETKLRRRGGQ